MPIVIKNGCKPLKNSKVWVKTWLVLKIFLNICSGLRKGCSHTETKSQISTSRTKQSKFPWGGGAKLKAEQRPTHLDTPPLGKHSQRGGHCHCLAGEPARGNSIWLKSPQCSRRGPCRCLPWGADRGTRRDPDPLWPLRLRSPLPAPLNGKGETQWGPTSGAQQQQQQQQSAAGAGKQQLITWLAGLNEEQRLLLMSSGRPVSYDSIQGNTYTWSICFCFLNGSGSKIWKTKRRQMITCCLTMKSNCCPMMDQQHEDRQAIWAQTEWIFSFTPPLQKKCYFFLKQQ